MAGECGNVCEEYNYLNFNNFHWTIDLIITKPKGYDSKNRRSDSKNFCMTTCRDDQIFIWNFIHVLDSDFDQG